MKRLSILFAYVFVLATPLTYAQNDCGCLKNFDAVVEKVTLNYTGFMDKTNGTKMTAHNQLRDSLQTIAAKTTDGVACFDVLAAYTLFFKDKHLQLGNYQTRKLPNTYEKLSVEQARRLTHNARPDNLVGIWRREDGKVQVAILHQPGADPDGFNYRGVVLSSQDTTFQPGLVLFRVKQQGQSYFVKTSKSLRNHLHPTKQHGNIFYANWDMTLVREYPYKPTLAEQQELAINKINNGFHVRSINKDVALISIRRGFNLSDEVMDSVLRHYEPLLRNTPNLIIDLRDNGGGNNTWEKMLPYIYDGPIEMQGGWYTRASEDNIRMIEEDEPDGRKDFIKKLRQNMGKLVSDGGNNVIIKLDSIRTNPQRVAMLVNDICASSSEFLIQVAKKTKRTTVFGSNTAGMMDYGDLRRPAKLPCIDLHLVIPMAKSPWTDTAPIDPTGIIPDVNLSHLPEAQWLDYVTNYLVRTPIAEK